MTLKNSEPANDKGELEGAPIGNAEAGSSESEAEKLKTQLAAGETELIAARQELADVTARNQRQERENVVLNALVEHGCTKPREVLSALMGDLGFVEEDDELRFKYKEEPFQDVEELVAHVRKSVLPELFREPSREEILPRRKTSPHEEIINELSRIS